MIRIELNDVVRTQSLAPGEHYPLSHEDLQAKIRFAWLDDYQAQGDCDEKSLHVASYWSQSLKVANFYHK